VLAASRYRLSASAYLPGAAAVGVEQRILWALEERLPDSNPDVRVALTDLVTVGFTLAAASLVEARAEGRVLAERVLLRASPIAIEAVELVTPPAVPA
jgi:hypothetical protein